MKSTTKQSVNLSKVLMFLFKLITFPFYCVYLFLFKIPTDGPAKIVGFCRFSIFVTLSILITQNHKFEYFIKNLIESNEWFPISSNVILAIIGIIMLINLPLSFFEMFGFSTGSYWYNPHESNEKNSFSGYDAIEEGIDYRNNLLKAKHTPGKIKELKKRLEDRGYSSLKVRENVDSEIFDICLTESMESGHKVFIIETDKDYSEFIDNFK